MRSEILKAAVQAAHADEAQSVQKAWKRFKNSPRQASSDWSNAYKERTLQGDKSPVNNRKYEMGVGPKLPGYQPRFGTGGYKEYFANPKTQRKVERKAKAGAGASSTTQRIISGNLRRQGSYSPKRFQFTP